MNGVKTPVFVETEYAVRDRVIFGPHHGYVGRIIITENGVCYGVYYWHNEEQKFIELYGYELGPE